jgi:glycosyltransferase involved in cell wall biosynthesis
MNSKQTKKFLMKASRKAVNLSVKPLKFTAITKSLSSKALYVALREVNPERLSSLELDGGIYNRWVLKNMPSKDHLALQNRVSKDFKIKPTFSILVPVYNAPIDCLKACIESVINQSYKNWELCLADDKSTDKDIAPILEEYAKKDSRIKVTFRKKNGHISEATNSALELAGGDFIALLDNDDILWPNALYEFANRVNEQPTTDFIYSDEDKIDASGALHFGPFFKPDWNPDFLRSVNYITHFTAIKTSIVKSIGGERKGYEGAQDWDLFLRATKKAKNIQHISKILYSWRVLPTSTAGGVEAKPYVTEAQRLSLTSDLKNYSNKLGIVEENSNLPDSWQTSFKLKEEPLVSIIIPTKDQTKVLKRCLNSVYKKTNYKNFEVIVIDTGSSEPEVSEIYEAFKKEHKNFKQVEFVEPKFSYSKTCNFGVKQSSGQYVLLLNNDTEVLGEEWIEEMLGDAMRPEIGMVGVKLYYPGRKVIQHAGTAIGIGADNETRVAGNILSGVDEADLVGAQLLYAQTKKNVTAVTAACAMLSRIKFDEVGGLDEKDFKVTYNDVDLSLKLLEAGYRNLYNPAISLIHHESISLGKPEEGKRDTTEIDKATEAFRKKWSKYINYDPNYNSNFTKSNAIFEIKLD